MIYQNSKGYWLIEGDQHGSKCVEETGRLEWDGLMLHALAPYIKEGTVVLDIGANIGAHTSFYLNKVGRRGDVVSFEPHSEAFKCLELNCPRALAQWIALSDYDGKGVLKLNDESPSLSELQQVDGDVIVMKLDTWWGIGLITNPEISFVKLDVEGHEPRVIRGGLHFFKQYKPVVCMEVHPGFREANEEAQRLLELLGYTIKPFKESWADIIAIP